ncbi:hypothetical protein L3Q82_021937 [Scortum barcoo]|uniref:Uncharacterized protein n=1 Tax=Scortum barcoo TaxID=214431 RepID=A0ACB8WZY8_9TELE|nr:hypothetical protein L3Q82_021937 [Scortum barcoo]
MIPAYKPLICRTRPTTRTVQVWTEEASSALQDCFECTDWEVFKEGTDLDGYTSSVLSYLKFCTDAVLPTKTIKRFPKSKTMAGQHTFNTVIPDKADTEAPQPGTALIAVPLDQGLPHQQASGGENKNNTSSTLVLSTGTPQGCMLSPALFTLFTSDCSAIHSTNTIVKFIDDTTMVGLILDNDETHCRSSTLLNAIPHCGDHGYRVAGTEYHDAHRASCPVADRNTRERGKKKGGGIALFVNDKWCNPGHIHVKEQRYTRDIELLAVSIWPYYLPREFSHVITITTYIRPSANADAACELLHSVVAQLQTEHPQAFVLITGDFNHASLSATLPNFHQYVNCCTRDNKTLDLLYANTAGSYSSSPLPPLGRSDHNLVHLFPVYTPMVKRQAPQQKACEAVV